MSLKTTIDEMKWLLDEMNSDLEKTLRGNRAAAQRVRTHSIKFAKTAKLFRKESVAEGKKGPKKSQTKTKAKAKAAKTTRKVAKKVASAKKKTAKKRK